MYGFMYVSEGKSQWSAYPAAMKKAGAYAPAFLSSASNEA
jgi:hypothetical protein